MKKNFNIYILFIRNVYCVIIQNNSIYTRTSGDKFVANPIDWELFSLYYLN